MIVQKYRKCKKCGIIGGVFVTRTKLLSTGKIGFYIENKCTLCANEEARDHYYRRRKNPELLIKERLRLREFKRNNKEKIKEQARIYWLKNREDIQKKRNLKKSMVDKTRKRHSHHRVPTNKHMFCNFYFGKNLVEVK